MPRDPSLRLVYETHATSLDNEEGLASGWFDAALSPTGVEQARMLGARRREDHLALVFSSDLSRSFRTAEIAFGDRSLPIIRDARLRECDYGATAFPAAEWVEAHRLNSEAVRDQSRENCPSCRTQRPALRNRAARRAPEPATTESSVPPDCCEGSVAAFAQIGRDFNVAAKRSSVRCRSRPISDGMRHD
jgi:broad specificity phosphatase PhoE